MARALHKYLASYAEPEARFAVLLTRRYERAVVVPACDESAALLEAFTLAAHTSSGRTLAVVVVNGRADAADSVHEANARTVAELAKRLGARHVTDGDDVPLHLAEGSSCDVLIVDRGCPGFRFPPKQGVGLARKIGADIAVALFAAGRLGRFVFFTDADAHLPEGHFDATNGIASGASLVAFPYWHEDQGDAEIDRATALYEISLRYYERGLSWAGSPYACPTLGSALAVAAEAYAAVRGVPKREAGEDFYLVNKLLKVGSVVRPNGAPVRIRARRSKRTPFGTGSAVAKLADGELLLYDPRCFEGVRAVLGALLRFSQQRSTARLRADIDSLSAPIGHPAARLLDELRAETALGALASTAPTEEALRGALHRWFDGFRTLKLVHLLSAVSFPKRPLHEALREAPFVADPSPDPTRIRLALMGSPGLADPGYLSTIEPGAPRFR